MTKHIKYPTEIKRDFMCRAKTVRELLKHREKQSENRKSKLEKRKVR